MYSPFFPPRHIGAETGWAKRELRITCMRMLRTTPFSPPKSGENHIWKYFPDLACGAIFWIIIIYKQQFLHKSMSINPNTVEFHQYHDKRHSICLLTTISKITTEIFVKICWQSKTPTSELKVHRLHYANELLVSVRLSFQNLSQTLRLNMPKQYKICLGKELWRVLVDKSVDHDKSHFDLFSTTISTSKKIVFLFFFRTREDRELKRHCATHSPEQRSYVGN